MKWRKEREADVPILNALTAAHTPWHPPRQVVVTKVRQLAADANLTMDQFISMESSIQV